jgi:hypothetical protein
MYTIGLSHARTTAIEARMNLQIHQVFEQSKDPRNHGEVDDSSGRVGARDDAEMHHIGRDEMRGSRNKHLELV